MKWAWYKRSGGDFIRGTAGMTLEEKGAYSLCLDLIYDRGGPIPDDARWIAGICNVSLRKWTALRLRLIDLGKLTLCGGHLSNPRAEIEIKAAEHLTIIRAINGAKGGRNRAENELTPKKNNDLEQAGLKHLRDRIEEEEKKEEDGGKPPSGNYAFEGETIKLTEADYTKWQKIYHAVPDIVAELYSLDSWFQDQDEAKRKKWFHTAKGALNRKHQEMLTAAKAEAANDAAWEMMS